MNRPFSAGDLLLNTYNGGSRRVTKVNDNGTVQFEGSILKGESMSKFKVGDKVRVNSKANSAFFTEGAEGVVINANPEDFEVQFYKGEYDPAYAGVRYVNPEVVDLIEETEEEASEESLFKVGQTVWCLIFGKGEVTDYVNHYEGDPYTVYVVFGDGEGRRYTQEGKYYEYANRTLFFSEPKIEAETKPPFESKIRGKEVMIDTHDAGKHVYAISDETEEAVYIDKVRYWMKKDIKSLFILEEVKL